MGYAQATMEFCTPAHLLSCCQLISGDVTDGTTAVHVLQGAAGQLHQTSIKHAGQSNPRRRWNAGAQALSLQALQHDLQVWILLLVKFRSTRAAELLHTLSPTFTILQYVCGTFRLGRRAGCACREKQI